MVMILAGAVPQRAPQAFPPDAAGNVEAAVVLAATYMPSLSRPAIAQHLATNQLDVVGHTFSEPLLLLLMGTLLITVGTSLRRWTNARRGTRATVPRQT